MLHFDMPYGVTDAAWDVLVSAKKLEAIITQFKASQQKDNWVFFAWVHQTQYGIVHDVLVKCGLQGITPIYWVKENHHTPTPTHTYTRACEVGILGFFPGPGACSIRLSKDPRKRHNVFTCKSVTKYARDEKGNILNSCQKPIELAQWIFGNHCMPGEHVLTIGPGAGGCTLGALMNGNSVVAVESDKHQWEQLRRIALKWSSDETALLTKASQQEGIDLLHHDGQGNRANTNPSVPSSATSSNVVVDAPLSAEAVATCASCGEEIKQGDPQLLCQSGSCGDNEWYHKECGEKIDDKFHCTECVIVHRAVEQAE